VGGWPGCKRENGLSLADWWQGALGAGRGVGYGSLGCAQPNLLSCISPFSWLKSPQCPLGSQYYKIPYTNSIIPVLLRFIYIYCFTSTFGFVESTVWITPFVANCFIAYTVALRAIADELESF
jgi:hypothetical protein